MEGRSLRYEKKVDLAKLFLGKNNVHLMTRLFARKAELAQSRVTSVNELLAKAHGMKIDSVSVFTNSSVLVWDTDNPKSDCGKTYGRALNVLPGPNTVNAENRVLRITHGDLFCHILNQGLFEASRAGADFVLIISAEAIDYLTVETMVEVLAAAYLEALVVGVAIHEFRASMLAGFVENTFCLWSLKHLVSVGGFDLCGNRPLDSSPLSQSDKLPETMVHLRELTIEEIIPIVRMMQVYGRTYGHIIAPVIPSGLTAVAKYTPPNTTKDPEWAERHARKVKTKRERQEWILALMGLEPVDLYNMILPQYRDQK